MLSPKAIEQWLLERVPQLGNDEGVRFGDPNVETDAVLVCWMATVDALNAAAQHTCQIVICHEDPFYPYEGISEFGERNLSWTVNRKRMRIALEHDITIFRAHGSLDRVCVYDAFAEMLNIPNPNPGTGWNKVFHIERTTVRELAQRAKRAMGMQTLRVIGDLDRQVTCVGLVWGGLGLFVNVSYMERLINMGAEVLIGGETDEYAMRYALDAGVALIETSHAASENPGLKRFAEMLQRSFPDARIIYYEVGIPHQFI